MGELKEPEQFSTLLRTNEAIKAGLFAKIGSTVFFSSKNKSSLAYRFPSSSWTLGRMIQCKKGSLPKRQEHRVRPFSNTFSFIFLSIK